MERLTNHHELQELLGAYALHATDPAETDLVAGHLEDCAECREELSVLLDTAAAIGGSHPVAPAPSIWDRIITEIRNDAAQAAHTARSTPSDGAATGTAIAPVIDLTSARSARRGGRGNWLRSLAAAAAAVAIAVPVTAYLSQGSTSTIAALARDAGQQPGARRTRFVASNGAVLATAVLTRDGGGYMIDPHLPQLPAGKTYQLWAVTTDGPAPISAAVLGANPKASAFTVAAPTKALAISVEAASGASAPTSAPIAVGELI